MVTTTRFYPKGYVGTEQGILLVAKLRAPENWQSDKISPEERQVWNGLGSIYNAEYLPNHLSVLVPIEQRKNDTSMIDRLGDYRDAVAEVRKALYAGELVAEFLDEAGQPGWILKEGWGGDAGQDILLRGIVDLADGWTRLVQLRIDKLELLGRPEPATASPASELAEKSGGQQIGQNLTTAQKRELFKNWRAARANLIPTVQEDVAHMKSLGINRDDTRELRRDYPSLPRGKPKAKSRSQKR